MLLPHPIPPKPQPKEGQQPRKPRTSFEERSGKNVITPPHPTQTPKKLHGRLIWTPGLSSNTSWQRLIRKPVFGRGIGWDFLGKILTGNHVFYMTYGVYLYFFPFKQQFWDMASHMDVSQFTVSWNDVMYLWEGSQATHSCQ